MNHTNIFVFKNVRIKHVDKIDAFEKRFLTDDHH